MRNPGLLYSILAATGLLLLPASITAAPMGDAQVRQISEAAEKDVIVILRDQAAGVPAGRGHHAARKAALATAQAPLVSELQRLKAPHIHGFHTVNAIAARLSPAAIAQLAAHPLVQAVVPDLPIRQMPRNKLASLKRDAVGVTASAAPTGAAAPAGGLAALCGTLEPEALQLTRTAFADPTAAQAQSLLDGNGLAVTGQGVRVAFLADGMDPTNAGFTRPDGSPVFADYQDFSGDPVGTPTGGAEAFGDASSIAAQDNPNGSPLLYDISQVVNPAHPLPAPCNIQVRGMAPGAALVGLKVFSSLGYTTTSGFVQAIEYAVGTDHVDVINESFGGNPYPDTGSDPISLANAAAVAAGVTVVASTGDAGTNGTLGSPSTDPSVIAVGASTSFRLYAQTGYGAAPLVSGGALSNNISALSSGGFSQTGARTVDVVAPGDLGWALCSTDTVNFPECTDFSGNPSGVQAFGGTSESAPLTAGEAALVIQAYRSTHGGASPTPAQVKQIIMSTASDLGAPVSEQGAGLINSLRAVQAALSLKDANGSPAASGSALVAAPNALELSGFPGSSQLGVFTVTNTGSTAQKLNPQLQTLGSPLAGQSVNLTLDPTTMTPFLTAYGATRVYTTQTFVVPAGADHLDAAVAFQSGASVASALVYVGLQDPAGNQVAYSLPQGAGSGYAHSEVVHPLAGTWTAFIWTRPSGVGGSYAGPLQFSWAAQRYVSLGSVSPSSVTLAPGASATLLARFRMPAQAGDTGAAVRFSNTGADGSTLADLPISLRTLVPIGEHGGKFSGTLTGGNGRPGAGPTQTFAFDVPPGAGNLAVTLNVSDPNYWLEGVLVDPSGMPMSVDANLDPLVGVSVGTLQAVHVNPMPGRWRFVLLQNYYASGNQTALTFNGTVAFNVSGIRSGLPNSTRARLHAGLPATVAVQVTNNSGLSRIYFADPRLATPSTVALATSQACPNFLLPGACQLVFVPPQTTAVQFLAAASSLINMDVYNLAGAGPVGITGSPDLWAATPAPGTALATITANEVPTGPWVMAPGLIGPYDATGAQPAQVSFAALATMLPFDDSMVPDTGNLWEILSTGNGGYNPLLLLPGQTGTINLTITPTAAPGTAVQGYVLVETFDPNVNTGDEVARLPYRYTVVP